MNKKKTPQQLSTFTSTYEHTVTCQKTHRENRQSTQSHELAQMFVKGVATLMFLKHRWAGNKRTFMWLWGSAYIHLISHPPSPLSLSSVCLEHPHRSHPHTNENILLAIRCSVFCPHHTRINGTVNTSTTANRKTVASCHVSVADDPDTQKLKALEHTKRGNVKKKRNSYAVTNESIVILRRPHTQNNMVRPITPHRMH